MRSIQHWTEPRSAPTGSGGRASGRAAGQGAFLVPLVPSVHYSLTRTDQLTLIVVDPGLVADPVSCSAPDQPQNPDPPRSSPG